MKTSNKYSGRKLKKPDMKQEGNFTQIPNAFILNPEIKNPELRLLQYIMMHSENRTIMTKNCIAYLDKTKPAISSSFEKLIELGVLKITDEIIEVIIPEEMKKYKLGYLDGKESLTIEVKKTWPLESEKTIQESKENTTIDVRKTLPLESEKTLQEGKENITNEVKKTYEIPLESIDNVNVTNPIILHNSRVLPAPATSGSAEQTHSNNNTKGKTAIELGLSECVLLQSLASPSVLAPSQHTPTDKGEKVDPTKVVLNDTLPIVEKSELPKEVETLPKVEPDKRFEEQLRTYNTSKYFLLTKLSIVKDIYKYYVENNPNRFIAMQDFEKVLACFIKVQIQVSKYYDINKCLMYQDDIKYLLKLHIHQFIKDMQDNRVYFQDLLKGLELNNANEKLPSNKIPIQVLNIWVKSGNDDCIDITAPRSVEGPEQRMANKDINDDFTDLPY